MTGDRAKAYRRVVTTVRDMGPATLRPAERACIRDAADALLCCRGDEDARPAFVAAVTLTDRLIEAGRWTSSRALRLLDDICACGPGAAMPEAIAA